MRKMVYPLFTGVFLLCLLTNLFAQIEIEKKIAGSILYVNSYNLKIKIPEGWTLYPTQDWHIIAAITSSSNPAATNSVFTLSAMPLIEDMTVEKWANFTAKQKAIKLQQKHLISLNNGEKANVLRGVEASANMYLFSINGKAYLYELIFFKKGKIGYMASCLGLRENDKGSDFRLFRQWIEKEVLFIDGNKDISDLLVKQMIFEERRLAGLAN